MWLRDAVARVTATLAIVGVGEAWSGLPQPGVRLAGLRAAVEEASVETTWPAPAVGDVVAFAGDWPGESLVGQVRSVQRLGERWMADVVPLEDQAGSLWRLPSLRRVRSTRTWIAVSELVPLAAAYVRESDAWAIERVGEVASEGLNGTAVGLVRRADGYRRLEDDYSPGGLSPRLDYEGERAALEAYEKLKQRLVVDTALVGGLGGLATYLLAGLADATAFVLGATSSLVYVVLLGKAADKAGEEGSDISDARLAPLAFAFLTLAAYHVVADPASIRPLSFLPRDEFVAAAAGVLVYRLPILAREIARVDRDEVLELAPGSVGVAARARREQQRNTPVATTRNALKTVLVLCGPPATGKTTLAKALVAADDRFVRATWAPAEDDPLDPLATRRDVVVDSSDGLLTREELLDRPDGKVAVVDCDVDAAKQLLGIRGARLVGVWVSLDSLEDLETRLQQAEVERALRTNPTDTDLLAEKVNANVRGRLASIVEDIDFGVTSDLFEFTIINDKSIDDALAALTKAVKYVFI